MQKSARKTPLLLRIIGCSLLCNVFASSAFATSCEDADGDGWGWTGSESCQVDSAIESVGDLLRTSYRMAADAAPIQIEQPEGNGTLTVTPATCQVKEGANSCDVVASFSAYGAGPHCLFERKSANDHNPALITCGNPTRIRVALKADQSSLLELRSGSLEYATSRLQAYQSVVAIRGIKNGEYVLTDTRQNVAMRNSKASSLATSWDGRLHFDAFATVNGKRVSVVRVFRGERLANKSAQELQSNNMFSNGYVFASDSMDRNQIRRSGVSLPGDLGKNNIGIQVPFNIAVYPDNRMSNNPYRSNAQGNEASHGNYETYRFYVVMGANKAGRVNSQHNLTLQNPARGKKMFLTRFSASVVVSNPRSANAKVHKVSIHSKAQPIRDTNGGLIYGYEPSATLDGRMIVYSGNNRPASRNGNGGELNYIFNADQHQISGWSNGAGVANMYYRHGPGSAAGETMIGAHRFSEYFPLAAFPVKQFNGEKLKHGDVIKGAYPWVSPRGSEIFFMARSTFHGADRSGGTVVGYRTNGQLWHLDGEVNNGRGNPTDSYGHWASGQGAGNQYRALVKAYEARKFTGTNTRMGTDTWSNLFFRPVGQFPTSWSAVSGVEKSPLPVNPFSESYGFWLTGNRYYEVSFPMHAADLVAHYPMNEALYHDQSMLRPFMNAEYGAPTGEQIRSTGIDYVTNKTADLSANQHTATLRNGAQYPFEYHNAKQLWRNSRILKDQNEGAVGNSVFFPRKATATAKVNAKSLKRIADTQSFSAAVWFNVNNATAQTNLLEIEDLFRLSFNRTNVQLSVANDTAREHFTARVNVLKNKWHHVAVSWSLGALDVYFDGKLVAQFSENAELLIEGAESKTMTMGPNSTGAGNLLLKLDDVYVYASQVSETDALKLALKKKVYKANSNSFFKTSGLAAEYSDLARDIDLSFKSSAAEIELGRALFNSTRLSSDYSISCASCHQASRDFTDGEQVFTGLGQKSGTLNTPTLVNSLLGRSYFYSGAAESLEVQSLHTMMQSAEMGVTSVNRVLATLPANLKRNMQRVYGQQPQISEVAKAISAFVRTIRVEGLTDNNSNNLTPAAQRGKTLFNGKANCSACHSGTNLTDNMFHDIGLDSDASDRAAATGRLSDRSRRKTPTLRNIALTAPYFNNGSAFDLETVVRHYNNDSHTANDRDTDPLLHPLELNNSEINDLVEYLGSLTGETRSGL